MNRRLGVLLAVCTVGAFGAATPVLANNPAGAYIGFGAGTSNVGNNAPCGYGNNCYGYGYGYGYGGGYGKQCRRLEGDAGIRPLPIIGAEVEYMDFGSADGNNGYYNNYYQLQSELAPQGDAPVRRWILAAAAAVSRCVRQGRSRALADQPHLQLLPDLFDRRPRFSANLQSRQLSDRSVER